MSLVSIGEFAQASRLSPKALRLYDELGLLVPEHVDPATGYRWYGLEQLERARAVSVLRPAGRARLLGQRHLGRAGAAGTALVGDGAPAPARRRHPHGADPQCGQRRPRPGLPVRRRATPGVLSPES